MRPKIILIIEDEKSLREALRDHLQNQGFETLEAQNGELGLKLALDKGPDLILLDIVMPVMDGLTMARKLRTEEVERDKANPKHIPIILLTNLSDSEDMTKAQKQGLYMYLVKSDWKLENVVKKIRDTLGV